MHKFNQNGLTVREVLYSDQTFVCQTLQQLLQTLEKGEVIDISQVCSIVA